MKLTALSFTTLLLTSCAAIEAYDAGKRSPSASASASARPSSPAGKPMSRAATPPPPVVVAAAPLSPKSKREIVLRMHGSNTIGSELAARLAEELLREGGATGVRTTDFDSEHRRWVVGEMGARRVAVEIWAPGTKAGVASIASGRCDVALASRPIEPGETRAPLVGHVIGLDGVAVIVHPSNRVARLSLTELRAIYAGVITDWSQVGGEPGAIQRYAREEKSGTYDTFVATVMHGRRLSFQNIGAYEDSRALAAAVAADPHAIGFVGLPYARDVRTVALVDGDAQPLYPSVFTVSTEDYPLARRLHLYTRADARNPLVEKLVSLALSDRGQRLVDASGFVTLAVRAQAYRAPKQAPRKYVEATKGAERLSVNFRFEKGSAQLDTKARQDVASLVRFLASEQLPRATMLFGFADKSGKESANVALSRERAQAVAGELRAHGVALDKVDGLGSALPVSSDDSERNRRVEVWIR